MLKWFKCGDYFNSEDCDKPVNEFTNNVSDSYISLTNGTSLSLINDDKLYFHTGVITNDQSSLKYAVDSKNSEANECPVKIKFKMRVTWEKFKDPSYTSIRFIGDLYIHYIEVNGSFTLCFSDVSGDTYIPFTREMLSGEWTDFELMWVAGYSSVLINDRYILSFESPTPLDETVRDIINYDKNFEIYIDLAEVEFWRMYETGDSIHTKVVESRNDDTVTLNIVTDAEDNILNEPADYIRIEFANLTDGQIINFSNMEIDRCMLYYEKEINKGIYNVKTFIDTDSMDRFKVHIYNSPNIRHCTSIDNYKYDSETGTGNTVNVLFGVKQNGVNLTGRHLKIRQNLADSQCLPVTYNVYFNNMLYSSVDRNFSSINFYIPDLPFTVNNMPYVPSIHVYERSDIKIVYKSFNNATVYTQGLEISGCDFVRNEMVEGSLIDCYKVYLNPAGVEFKVHVYVETTKPENIVRSIADEYHHSNIDPIEGYYTDKVIIEFAAVNLSGETVSISGAVKGYMYAEWYVDGVLIGTGSTSNSGNLNVSVGIPFK